MAIQRPYAEVSHDHDEDYSAIIPDEQSSDAGYLVMTGTNDITPHRSMIQVNNLDINLESGGAYNIDGIEHTHDILVDNNTGYTVLEVGFAATDGEAYLEVTGGASGGLDPGISAIGTESNISINLTPKGTGVVKVSDVSLDNLYLGLTATASNSLLLGGASAAEFASSDHLHTGVYEPASGDIQTHITTVSGNPHSVTYTEVGAASTDHTHDMDDIIVDTTLRLRPQVEFGKIQATSKPTIVSRGVVQGYSFPIYNSDDEELFITQFVPHRWDEASNITFGCMAMLDTANTDKKFKLAIEWEQVTAGDVVGTSTVTASTEIDVTGAASQYMTYDVTMTIDYDANTPDVIEANDILAIRLRRVAASSAEITGEVVVYGFYIQYARDKIGPST